MHKFSITGFVTYLTFFLLHYSVTECVCVWLSSLSINDMMSWLDNILIQLYLWLYYGIHLLLSMSLLYNIGSGCSILCWLYSHNIGKKHWNSYITSYVEIVESWCNEDCITGKGSTALCNNANSIFCSIWYYKEPAHSARLGQALLAFVTPMAQPHISNIFQTSVIDRAWCWAKIKSHASLSGRLPYLLGNNSSVFTQWSLVLRANEIRV